MKFNGYKHPRGSFVLLALIGLAFIAGSATSSDLKRDEWPQWRGPRRDGTVSSFAAAWPDSLDESRLKSLWRVSLGPSYSGPIVVGDRVFVTETVDEKTEVVRELGGVSAYAWSDDNRGMSK